MLDEQQKAFNFTSSIRSAERFAEMLGQEKMRVTFSRSYETASFDLENRHLRMPLLRNDLSDDLYNMFVAHEVSHALNTPPEGWHESITIDEIPKGLLNIIEDIRIEKLIRRSYTGLYRTFTAARIELLDMDFFGIKHLGDDLSSLSFANRLNIHSKSEGILDVEFSEFEQHFVDLAMSVETWEEVVDVARKIMEVFKDIGQLNLLDLRALLEELGIEFDGPMPEDMMDNYAETKDELNDSTDQNYRQNEQEITRYDYKNAYISDHNLNTGPCSVKNGDQGEYDKFIDEYGPLLNSMVAQFNMKRNAINNARINEERNGALDPGRLHDYKFADDLFAREVIQPKQKNHGMILALDHSGSMDWNGGWRAVSLQAAILSEFCDRIGIKFQLNVWHDYSRPYIKPNMGRDRYVKAIANLYMGRPVTGWGGTTMGNGYVHMMQCAMDLKEGYHLDKVHTIMMTDGGSCGSFNGISLDSDMESLTLSLNGRDYTSAAAHGDKQTGWTHLAQIGRQFLGTQSFYCVSHRAQKTVTGNDQHLDPAKDYIPTECLSFDHMFAIESGTLRDITKNVDDERLNTMMRDFVDVII